MKKQNLNKFLTENDKKGIQDNLKNNNVQLHRPSEEFEPIENPENDYDTAELKKNTDFTSYSKNLTANPEVIDNSQYYHTYCFN